MEILKPLNRILPPNPREVALFAGAGGGILAGKLLGWKTVCAVEKDEFCAERLMQRQSECHLSPFPVWDDVCTFDGRPWRGFADIVSGGFPCQNISSAGNGEGIHGAKSILWFEMARIIREIRPRVAWVENSPLLIRRGLEKCLENFTEMGYGGRWGIVGAHHTGAPHKRDRLWILAYANNSGVSRGFRKVSRENAKI